MKTFISCLTAALALCAAGPARAGQATAEWTIMVYMNGKNNLADYVKKDINEMEAAGAPAGINIVVEAGRSSLPPAQGDGLGDSFPDVNPWQYRPGSAGVRGDPPSLTDQAWKYGVRRYLIGRDADPENIGSALLDARIYADMGDWNQLAAFGAWAKQNYPARRYMLIVWNHGDGWTTKDAKGISFDDDTGNHISTVELGQALAAMGGVDVYASDACLMQMAEVVYEIRKWARVVVGSEETAPGDGWDYTGFLSRLEPSMGPEDIGRAAVEAYVGYYTAQKKGVTMSAVRTEYSGELRRLTDEWADLAMTLDKEKLMAAMRETLSFNGATSSRDLLHFLKKAAGTQPALKEKTDAVAAFFSGRMLISSMNSGAGYKPGTYSPLYNSSGPSPSYADASGIGIYLQSYGFDDRYLNLAMSRDGRWDEFARWLTN